MKYDSLLRCQQLYEEFCESYIKQLNTLRIFSHLDWIYDGLKSSPAPGRKVQFSKSPIEILSQPKIKNTQRGRVGPQHCEVIYPNRVSFGTLSTADICRFERGVRSEAVEVRVERDGMSEGSLFISPRGEGLSLPNSYEWSIALDSWEPTYSQLYDVSDVDARVHTGTWDSGSNRF